MARPRKANSSANHQRKDNLSSLSTEVLKLRLQALHLPVTGSRATLIAALRAAQSGGSARSAPKKSKKTAAGRVSKRSTTGPRAASKRSVAGDTNRSSQTGQADTVDDIDDLSLPSDHEDALSGEDSDSDPDILIQSQGPSKSLPHVQSGFNEDQLAVIRNTVQVSVQAALANQNGALNLPTNGLTSPASPPFPTPGLATPLGLNRPLDRTLEDRILRGLQDVHAAPALSHTSVAGAVPPAIPSPVAHRSLAAMEQGPATASGPRSKRPTVSSPIDIDRLQHELLFHPNHNFVTTLIHNLRFGARIGYTGPRKPRVSRNLISASQHPEVVSSNLAKEIKMGRVAGPFLSSPLTDLQCHPVGVVPKKHSSEWRTIYHLSYPEGDSINDHIQKDLFSLQYVRVDDAIRLLQTLGQGSFMAKTDLKSAFRLIPIHPDDWNLLGIYWQSKFYVDLYLPLGSAVLHTSLINCPTP
ncbi:hypothetical protein ACROYT_G011380 [Oculina patagonica]